MSRCVLFTLRLLWRGGVLESHLSAVEIGESLLRVWVMFSEDSSSGSPHILEYCHGLQNISSGRRGVIEESLRKGRAAVQRHCVIGPERLPAR